EGDRRVRDVELSAVAVEGDRRVPGALGDLPALELGGQIAHVHDVRRLATCPVVGIQGELGACERLPPAQVLQRAAVAGLRSAELSLSAQSLEHGPPGAGGAWPWGVERLHPIGCGGATPVRSVISSEG